MFLAILFTFIAASELSFQVIDIKCVERKEYTTGGSMEQVVRSILPAQVCDGKVDCLLGVDEAEDLCKFSCDGADKLMYTIHQINANELAHDDWRKCLYTCYNKKYCSNVEFIFTHSGTLHRCDLYGTNVSALYGPFDTSSLYIMDKVRTVQLRSNCDLGCYANECYYLEFNEDVPCKYGSPATVSTQDQLKFLKQSIPLMLMLQGIRIGLANVSYINGFSGVHIRWQDGTTAEGVLPRDKKYGEKYCAYCGYQKIGRNTEGTEFQFEIVTEDISKCAEIDWYICKVGKPAGIHMPYASTILIKLSFQCGDGDFVSRLAVCDGEQDCIDGTDELDCTAEENEDCEGQLQCRDGGCVPYSVYCDFVQDCADGSDEDCLFEDCKGYEMMCVNGQCVGNLMLCNGHQECFDGSDEECELGNCWKDGKNYTGNVSHTVTGRTCQRWDSQVPQYHSYGRADYFPDRTLKAVGNKCRNPVGSTGPVPWCFTEDSITRWEYCPIPKCSTGPAVSAENCYTDPSTWQGTLSKTVSGRTCQNWSSQLPHSHTRNNPANFPDDNLTLAANFCRDPDDSGRPWCYTMDKNVRWEICAVPPCVDENCYINSTTWLGHVTHTASGLTCQMWSSQLPHSHEFTDPANFPDDSLADAANFCRDPSAFGQLWCYTTDNNVRWGVCDMPFCFDDSCYTNSTTWRGKIAHTASGRTCQMWSNQSPHRHVFTESVDFPDDNLTDANNFCRDPDNSGQPWCYTIDELVRWEFCDVPYCVEEAVTCPEGRVHCKDNSCIPIELLCDGDDDCTQGEDELECQNIDRQLLNNNYRCQNSSRIVLWPKICDGKMDCPHGDDERLCTVDKCPRLCHCDVYKVTCVGLKNGENVRDVVQNIPFYVRYLDLSSSNTTGRLSIPHHLPYIAMLNMSTCGFESVLIASMPNLLSCDISENRLSELNRNILDGLNHLQSIHLQNNLIANLDLDVFQDLLDTTFINASRNKIHALERQSVRLLRNLVTFDLSHNKLLNLTLNIFSGMTKLRVLLLQHNFISEIQAEPFLALNNLYFMDLSHNELTILKKDVFSAVKSLNILFLNNNFITKLSSRMFKWLTNLGTLSLEANMIRDVEHYCFKGLQELQTLDISRNEITKVQEHMFHGLCELQVLKTDEYKFCCLKPQTVTFANCEPKADEFSSCENLLRHEAARFLMWNIGLFALLGNFASLIYRITFDKRKLKIGYGVFVLNLTISDFFMGVYLLIIAGADVYYNGTYIWNDETWRGSSLCKFAGVLSTLSSEASVFFICLITIDRLLVIKYPFGRFKFGTKSAIIASSFSWLVAFGIALLPFLYTGYFGDKFYSSNAVCIALPLTAARPPGWEYALAVFVFFNFLTFLLIAFGQSMIFKEVHDTKMISAASSKRKADLTVARNLLLVVSTDFMCWCPVGIMGIMALTGYVISGVVNVWASVLILPINAALNPFLYTLSAIFKNKNFSPSTEEQTYVVALDRKALQSLWRKSTAYFSGTTPLQDIIKYRNLELTEIVLIILTIVNELVSLHEVGLSQECLDINNINVTLQNDVIQGALVKLLPKPVNTDENQPADVKQLGIIGRTLLKHIKVLASDTATESSDTGI